MIFSVIDINRIRTMTQGSTNNGENTGPILPPTLTTTYTKAKIAAAVLGLVLGASLFTWIYEPLVYSSVREISFFSFSTLLLSLFTFFAIRGSLRGPFSFLGVAANIITTIFLLHVIFPDIAIYGGTPFQRIFDSPLKALIAIGAIIGAQAGYRIGREIPGTFRNNCIIISFAIGLVALGPLSVFFQSQSPTSNNDPPLVNSHSGGSHSSRENQGTKPPSVDRQPPNLLMSRLYWSSYLFQNGNIQIRTINNNGSAFYINIVGTEKNAIIAELNVSSKNETKYPLQYSIDRSKYVFCNTTNFGNGHYKINFYNNDLTQFMNSLIRGRQITFAFYNEKLKSHKSESFSLLGFTDSLKYSEMYIQRNKAQHY